MQPVEVRHAVDAEQYRLAIEHERARAVLRCRFGDQGIAIGPIVAVAGEQPHALVFPLDDQAIAVMLDFVDSVWTGRDLGPAGRDAGLEGALGHVV
jgi:hypothetical protein